MLQSETIIAVALGYVGLLFAIAWYGDRRAATGRSLIASPFVYALSLAVYCTAWTFFGSVGLAAESGMAFLPTYLGPTLMAVLWPIVLIKMLHVARAQRITSIADFIAARYGKSATIAALVTVMAVVAIVPYIALQLKAVSISFSVAARDWPELDGSAGLLTDSALYIALFMAAFAMIFGTRRIDATERHEGLVAAVAFESLVKLLAFLALGIFVCFFLFSSPLEIFARAAEHPELRAGFTGTASDNWLTMLLLAMFAILLLPRQFQVAVVENVDPGHVRQAMWLFPLYLLLINLFVLPIALAGKLLLGADVPGDRYVLLLPGEAGAQWLTLLVGIGGLSAATSMIIVETTALATMISNDLVLPGLLRARAFGNAGSGAISRQLLLSRRLAILAVLLLGYAYFRIAGETRSLVSIGLISFAGVAQLAPALFGGLFWKEATRAGAMAGLLAGFLIWGYTLLLPSFGFAASLIADGPLGVAWLSPHRLFGMEGLQPLSHGVFWSLLVNAAVFVIISLFGRQDAAESAQAALFVDALTPGQRDASVAMWRGGAPVQELRALVARILGQEQAERIIGRAGDDGSADAQLMQKVESELAAAIGSASARIMVASIAREAPLSMEEVLDILGETSQAHYQNRLLEQKSRALARTTEMLERSNQQLREMDRIKDEFLATVTHELRTPLTSIRAFTEILRDNPALDDVERSRFLDIVVGETERLTRLINQVLDMQRLESQGMDWQPSRFELGETIATGIESMRHLFDDADVALRYEGTSDEVVVEADRDRITQVLLNLLANALKFTPAQDGRVTVTLDSDAGWARVCVQDNGPGIAPEDHELIFDKFHQSRDPRGGKPHGTGLGLPISRQIVAHFGGSLDVDSRPGEGARFCFRLPLPHSGDAA